MAAITEIRKTWIIIFFFFGLNKQFLTLKEFITKGLLALESILHLERFRLVKMVETLQKKSYFKIFPVTWPKPFNIDKCDLVFPKAKVNPSLHVSFM